MGCEKIKSFADRIADYKKKKDKKSYCTYKTKTDYTETACVGKRVLSSELETCPFCGRKIKYV